MSMLIALWEVEQVLPELLADEAGWQSVFADSEKPHLRRMWRQWGENRICLHRFTGCEPKEEFPHPHPWKMAVRILEGSYRMGVGHSADLLVVPKLVYRDYGPGDSYELMEPDIWHAIRPLGPEAVTVMVSGPVIYPQNRVRANKVVRELTTAELAEMFARFRGHYPR